MIPDFQTIMLPLLESLKDDGEHTIKQTHDALAAYFELEDEELTKLLSDSDQTVFYDHLHQAKSHLQKADLLQNLSQDVLKITPLGKQVLLKRLNSIDTQYLRRFPGYIESTNR